ncbi:WD40 repeat-like protein [Sanghuangporus baumii]|uniref:WD40 repeat-like protein n=1 Tax=Sanghuangporus baumii TaxID=108892 RepID=A0A9Q5NAC5_SANBA|nr:WD40 repeat-like protein [Sanghuangporus baumii]
MQHLSRGLKTEPIDVDDLFEGVEEVTSPPHGQSRPNRLVQKRLNKRQRMPGSSSHKPIVLDSDEEDCEAGSIVVENRRPGSFTANFNTPRYGRVISSLGGTGSQQNSQLPTQHTTKCIPMPMTNMHLHGLVAPAPSPSPQKPVPVAGPSRPIKQELSVSEKLIEERDFKMDIDSTTDVLSSAKLEDDYSSSDDFWEWSEYMRSDDEEESNGYMDMRRSLGMPDRETANRKASSSRCRTSIMSRPMTSTLRIPTDGQRSRTRPFQKPNRAWHTSLNEYYRDKYVPLGANYRELLQPRTGILSKRTALSAQNVFNCRMNVPPLRASAPHLKSLRTSSTINKIVQSHEFIAVASPTKGGGADPDTSSGPPEVDTYNREGNLIVWRGHKYLLLDGHTRSWPVEEASLRREESKKRAQDGVVDGAFSQALQSITPSMMLRSIRSGTAPYLPRLSCSAVPLNRNSVLPSFLKTESACVLRKRSGLEYSRPPYDIAYKPNSSLFAVSCYDGNVYIHKDNDRFPLEISNGRDSRPGTFIWGATSSNGALRNMLFTSTESDKEDATCRHTACDVERQCGEYELDINDCSDAMALDPQGKKLALITTRGPTHSLSFFDVGHNDGARVAGTRLHTLKPDSRPNPRLPLETTHASFSPDGIFLALARSDHRVHVYDVRYLGSNESGRPWAELTHPPIERPRNEHEEYGVTGLRWVEGWSPLGYGRGGLGLVTAGADDCVRLWDIMRSPTHPDESMILAKTDMDVTCFSVGDLKATALAKSTFSINLAFVLFLYRYKSDGRMDIHLLSCMPFHSNMDLPELVSGQCFLPGLIHPYLHNCILLNSDASHLTYSPNRPAPLPLLSSSPLS